jgi:two-component system, NarL family, sensor histidine kinase UhpB
MRQDRLQNKTTFLIGTMSNMAVGKLLKNNFPSKPDLQKLISEVIIEAQEKQRRELGKELHDNVNQVLATAKMFLGMAECDAERKEEFIKLGRSNLILAMEEIRKLSKSMVTPSLAIGLKEAIIELAEQINFTGRIHVGVIYKTNEQKKISPEIELMLYRISQEQLNNILKHANASEVIIDFSLDKGRIKLSIKDNGIGFNPHKRSDGVGLKNIEARVQYYSGKLSINASPGKGCLLEIIIPSSSD